MQIRAKYLESGVEVVASSIQDLCKKTGISARSFYRAGKPTLYKGWEINIPNDCASLKAYSRSLKKNQPDRSFRCFAFKDGVKVGEFLSAAHAEVVLRVDSNSINKVLRGERSSAGGFVFTRDEKGTLWRNRKSRSLLGKKYFLTNKEGVTYRFSSTAEVCLFLGVSSTCLLARIKKGFSEYKGYKIEVKQPNQDVMQLVQQILKNFASYRVRPDIRRHSSLTKQDLLDLTETKQFKDLWNAYSLNWDYDLKPSLDRIDPMLGYHLGNVQWVTTRENFKKARKEDHETHQNYLWVITNKPFEFYKSLGAANKAFKQLGYEKIPLKERPFIKPVKLNNVLSKDEI